MKKCTLCNENKAIECFTTKSGNVTTKCKECLSKLQKEWKIKNPNKAKKIKQREYKKNKESYDKRNNKWAEDNRERSNEIKKQWKIRNKEKYLKQQREYANNRYENNIKRERERCKYWRDNNSQKYNKSYKNSCEKYPEKIKARTLVNCALRTGFLIRPCKCSNCKKEGKIEAHHPDYSKPLEIIWLCRRCHGAQHRVE